MSKAIDVWCVWCEETGLVHTLGLVEVYLSETGAQVACVYWNASGEGSFVVRPYTLAEREGG